MLCPSHITPTGSVRAVHGLVWTKIVSPLTGLVRPPCGARATYGYGVRKQPVNSPEVDHKPVRPTTTPVRDFCKSLLSQFSCVSMRVPYGSRMVPYGPRMIWKTFEIPMRARTTPVQASHGVHVESCKLFDQTISVYSSVKRYGALSLMWLREQHRRKIPTCASLGRSGKKSYGC